METPATVRILLSISGFMGLLLVPFLGIIAQINLFLIAWALCMICWLLLTPAVVLLSVISSVIIVRAASTVRAYIRVGVALTLALVSDDGLYKLVNYLGR